MTTAWPWTRCADEPPPALQDVLLAYPDPVDGAPLVSQGCRKLDDRYVLTPEAEGYDDIIHPTHWAWLPPHPEDRPS